MNLGVEIVLTLQEEVHHLVPMLAGALEVICREKKEEKPMLEGALEVICREKNMEKSTLTLVQMINQMRVEVEVNQNLKLLSQILTLKILEVLRRMSLY